MKKGKLLIVDDNPDALDALEMFLDSEFDLIKSVKNPNLIPGLINNGNFDVILLDMNFSAGINSGNEGIYWLKKILKIDKDAVIVLITAYGGVELAVTAIKEGAFDFVMKPWDNDKLLSTLKAAFKLRETKLELERLKSKQRHLFKDNNKNHNKIIGYSPVMKRIFATINKVASTDVNVLILGENGTGKELIAREVHNQSKRKEEVLISVDMASLSETLFESELFGHEKGAFTDAKERRAGRFETASGGSLFLDEIGNLPLTLQAKLLAVLENREITRIGSNTKIPVDIRLICATNKNLEKLVEEGLFREDLLYRINTIQIETPTLRSRGDDIVLLANFFLNIYGTKYEKNHLKINSRAIDKLRQYHWPGNVRELQHTIEKAVILTDSDILKPESFMLKSSTPEFYGIKRTGKLEDIEKQAIMDALDLKKGNLSEAAKELGISRQTIYNKMRRYGL